MRLEDRFSQTRDLLYMTRQPRDQLIPDLRAAGWRAILADSLQRVGDLCRGRTLTVGLVDLGSPSLEPHLLPDLLIASGSGVQWIALLTRDQLQRAEVRSAVARFCFDFSTTPVPVDLLVVILGRAYGMAQVRKDLLECPGGRQWSHGIIGNSEAIERVRRSIATFAGTDAPVLIIGETGTGKELSATAIHAASARHRGPLIAVNCGALPPTLIQSELFGYERGAFTGADRRGIGKLEAANHGTIFLDEIGDLPALMQVNLLRFLQEHRIQRVGGSAEIELDLRVIAATNVDLERAVREGRFREDLFYRLNVLQLRLPPLRDCIEDIGLLAEHISQNFLHEKRYPIKGFSQGALTAMRAHTWPGNVRELVNRVRRAMIVCEQCLISAEDLGLEQIAAGGATSLDDARCQAELEAVRRAFLLSRGNISEAARRLNVTRNTLYRLMRKFALDPKAIAPPSDGPQRALDWTEQAASADASLLGSSSVTQPC